jgi:hypothetical protein
LRRRDAIRIERAASAAGQYLVTVLLAPIARRAGVACRAAPHYGRGFAFHHEKSSVKKFNL